ncbi:MAG TPA: response regulator [Aggregatilineaceae bacterium]|nr:response regulator [Aggregatilineaceae bacterium]
MGLQAEAAHWTVLIVEDEPDNLGVPETILSFHGTRVLTAENGIEALKILDTEMPTFILLDLSMPQMDGWQTLAAIRSNPRLASIPVIALTAYAMKSDQERALAAGFNGYIVKPFFIVSFWQEIERCLSQLEKPLINAKEHE